MNSQILDLRVRISDVFFLAASLHLSVLGTEAPAKAAKGTSISSAAIVSPSRPALGKITSSEYSEKSPNVRKVISPFPTTPAAISPPATLEQQSLSLLATERPAPSLTSNALSSSEDTTAQFTSQTEAEATGENAKAGVVPKMRAPKSAKEKMAFQKTTESRNVRPSTEMPSATGISKVSMALTIRTKRTTKPPYAPAFQSPATTMAVLRTKIRTFTSIDMDDYSDIEKFLDKPKHPHGQRTTTNKTTVDTSLRSTTPQSTMTAGKSSGQPTIDRIAIITIPEASSPLPEKGLSDAEVQTPPERLRTYEVVKRNSLHVAIFRDH